MTKREQIEFVRDMCFMIGDEVVSLIKNNKMPDKFDGHELRVLLSEKFMDAARLSLLRKHPHSVRAKDYREWRATTGGV